MSFFFFIFAWFTAPACDRKGSWEFMRRRLIRLGIPLLVYYYVLSLILKYLVRCFQGRADMGFLEFFMTNFGEITSPGPLWFTGTLLIFEAVYLLVRFARRRVGRGPQYWPFPKDWMILLFILGAGVFTFFLRLWQPLTHGVYHVRLGYYTLYVCMFAIGIAGYRSGWFEKLSARQANRWFYIALIAIVFMPVILLVFQYLGYNAYDFWGGWNIQSYLYAAWEPFLCVGINMKLIQFYRDHFNWTTPLTRRLAKSSYTAYITHAYFIVVPTWLFTFFSLGRIPEVLLMWPVAVIPCFLCADGMRRLPLLRRIL
jgi:glucans biosynthesis protein C